jgi:uncharacterized membrane protein YdjX (TVP38/TMEM64 family)
MDSRRAALLRIGVYAAVVGSAFLVLLVTGSLPSPERARDFGESLGDWALVAYVPLFVLANFLITWPILAGAGGLLLGTAAATPLALAAVTLAALAQMAVARRLAGEHAPRLIPRRLHSLDAFLERNGAVAVMETRIVPFLPWGAVNYSAGVTRLRYRDMAAGTVIGAAPKVFAYVALGGSLSEPRSPEAIVAVGLLVILALGGAFLVRRQFVAERRAASA